MRIKKSKKSGRPIGIPGMVNANILLPERLHESMKTLRQRRRALEQSDVKLCKLYREAVEQYVSALPQQRLLNGDDRELLSNTA